MHAIWRDRTGARDFTRCRQNENPPFAAYVEPPGGTQMSIPKEVILDLLPVYLAGEASPATRAWLEEYLAQDPELADRVRRQRTESLDQTLPPLPPELELRALRRTRRMMTLLRWLF